MPGLHICQKTTKLLCEKNITLGEFASAEFYLRDARHLLITLSDISKSKKHLDYGAAG